jgi:hypothetical protein
MPKRRNKFWSTWEAAYDKRTDNPATNYGIHGMEVRFYYGNKYEGIIQFVIYTNWHLLHVTKEQDAKYESHFLCHPLPADAGYHSPEPEYEGQAEFDCDLLKCGKCYYDGSGLQAEEWFAQFLAGGEERLRELMKEEWDYHFKNKKTMVKETLSKE